MSQNLYPARIAGFITAAAPGHAGNLPGGGCRGAEFGSRCVGAGNAAGRYRNLPGLSESCRNTPKICPAMPKICRVTPKARRVTPKIAGSCRKSAGPCRKLAQPSRKLRSHPEMYPVVIYIREVQGQGVFMFKIMKHYVTICNN